eukprot:TRINITY_DN1532_c0_g1_i5.p1 TRINITY_DN1532_c0_g1~~TRINITY_DN1532_c0_g1_i5.p1  ORF type:complete len:110 (+),score=26.82 TRINITY_DN1532_c0_g1_i5:176-505(+)
MCIRDRFTIGLSGVFSLGGWSRQIHTGFHVPRTTQDTAINNGLYLYGTITLYGLSFQTILIHNASNIAVLQPVSYTHLRAHETVLDLVCRLLLEKKKKKHILSETKKTA